MKKLLVLVLLVFLSGNSYSENKGYYLCLGSFNNKAKFFDIQKDNENNVENIIDLQNIKK